MVYRSLDITSARSVKLPKSDLYPRANETNDLWPLFFHATWNTSKLDKEVFLSSGNHSCSFSLYRHEVLPYQSHKLRIEDKEKEGLVIC